VAPKHRHNHLFFQERRRIAVEKVATALAEKYHITALSLSDASNLGLPKAERAALWAVDHGEIAEAPRLFVSLPGHFPAAMPQLFLPDREHWHLAIPHINKDGSVCVRPPQSTINQADCGKAVCDLLEDGIDEIRRGIAGANRDDFVTEVESYWGQNATDDLRITALFDLRTPSRWVKAVFIKERARYVVGTTLEQIERWMRQYAGGAFKANPVFDAPFVWLNNPLFPDEYPKTNRDLFRLIEAAGLGSPAESAMKARSARHGLPVLIAFGAEEVAAIGGVVRKMELPVHGFRPASVTGATLIAQRAGCECGRHVVERASPQWLHWRGGAKNQFDALAKCRVMIIGCGALGADVAMLLAKAGVGRFTLVDNDSLSWDNIGRHINGAHLVGYAKTAGLASTLTKHFPHLAVTTLDENIQRLVADPKTNMAEHNIVVCMTADWMGESILNAWARRNPELPVIFGWLEPHSLAGHALLVANGGCLACGRNEAGEVREPVIKWDEEQMLKTPACGGWFTPYGAIDSGPVKDMIAQLVVDVLVSGLNKSTLRTFIGDTNRAIAMGGAVREPWRHFIADETVLNRTITQLWVSNDQCPQCR
jgi:hypothetical protein